MKVGTDGVLLGAWTNAVNAKTVLDIGTGTGLIALMMAQQTDANIMGIEIENSAADEAAENAKNSPWGNRVTVENISFQQFAAHTKLRFDLIVSNPPFHTNSLLNRSQTRTLARHNVALPFTRLIEGVVKLLTKKGRFSIILPQLLAAEFMGLANGAQLNLIRLTEVKPKAGKKANRVLMEFSKEKSALEKEEMAIYCTGGSGYSEKYIQLTRDFYLHF